MKITKAIIVILTLIVLSIGVVSAADSCNVSTDNSNQLSSTCVDSSNYTNDVNTLRSSQDLVSNDNINLKSSNQTSILTGNSISINKDNYYEYFDKDGNMLSSTINKDDTLDLDGDFKDLNFKLTIPITLTSTNNNANLYNSTVSIYKAGSGSTISNLHIENNNPDFHGIAVYSSDNNTIINNYIYVHGTSSFALAMGGSNHNIIRGNFIKTSYTSVARCHSTLVLFGCNYTLIDDNTVETDDANSIYASNYAASGFEGGLSYYNNVTNNKITTTVESPSSWNIAIQLMGSYNNAIGNTVNNAYTGISTSGNITNNVLNGVHNNAISGINGEICDNTFNNCLGTGISVGSNTNIHDNTLKCPNTCLTISVTGSNILVKNNIFYSESGYGISFNLKNQNNLTIIGNDITCPSSYGIYFAGKNSNITIKDNTIKAKTGIQLESRAEGGVISENNIKSTDSYTIYGLSSKNFNITNNYLIASSLKGDSSVNVSSSDIVKDNTPKDMALINTTVSAGNVNIEYGETGVLNVNVVSSDDSTVNEGSVTIKVNSQTLTENVKDGACSFTLPNEGVGTYPISISYSGSETYNTSSSTASLTVNSPAPTKVSTSLKANNLNLTYGETGVLKVNVITADSSTVNAGTVTVILSNGTKITENVKDNACSFNLTGNKVGISPISITYSGSDNYKSSSTNVNFTVNKVDSKVNVPNLTGNPGSSVNVTINVTGLNGELINNGTLTVNFNNETKTFNVSNGSVVYEIQLPSSPGSYNLTATFNGDSVYNAATGNSKISVGSAEAVLSGDDLVLIYGDIENYTVKLVDTLGNPIIGQHLSVNLTRLSDSASKVYSITTNKEGIAKLEINLAPGSYSVTSTFNGTDKYQNKSNVTNSIIVKTSNMTLIINDLSESFGAGDNLTGKLLDSNGKALSGQHIALNLTNPRNGASKIYWVTTDTNGEYQLEIDLSVGTYTATASYKDLKTAPANIMVTNPGDNHTSTVLSANKYNQAYGASGNFTGKLLDTNGKAIIGQHIALNLSNLKTGASKVYWVTTDINGEYQLAINLYNGEYAANCSYTGTSIYSPSNASNSITVY